MFYKVDFLFHSFKFDCFKLYLLKWNVTENIDFEHGFGIWTNPHNTGDQFDWIIGSSGTSSQYTGPQTDHTLGNSTGQSTHQYLKIFNQA